MYIFVCMYIYIQYKQKFSRTFTGISCHAITIKLAPADVQQFARTRRIPEQKRKHDHELPRNVAGSDPELRGKKSA